MSCLYQRYRTKQGNLTVKSLNCFPDSLSRLARALLGFAVLVLATGTSNAQSNANAKAAPNSLKSPKEAIAIYADAANFQNNSAFDLAIEEWTKLIERFPSDPLIPKAYHYLGVCYLQIGEPNYEKAIESLQCALREPNLEVREESLVNLGWALFSVGSSSTDQKKSESLAKARQVLKQYLSDYADGVYVDRALFYAAECEYLLGKKEEAGKLYRQFLSQKNFAKSPFRPDVLYAMGVNYEELKQDSLAKEAYDEFLAKFPEHRLVSEVRLRKAEFLLAENKPQEAVEMLRQVVKQPNLALPDYAMSRLAYALAKSGKFDESSSVYQQIAERFPNSPYALTAQLAAGQTLMREKKYDEAAAFFKRLLPQKNEQAAEAAHWLCQILILQGKPADAIPFAKDALSWATSSRWTTALQMDYADGLNETVDGKQQAREWYLRISRENPDDPLAPRALYNAAFSSLRLGEHQQALTLAERLVSTYPQDQLAVEAKYIRAESALQLSRFEDGIRYFNELINQHTDNPQRGTWLLRLATAAYFGEQYDLALRAVEQAKPLLDDKESQAELYYLAGASLIETKQMDEAVANLGKSLAIAPTWSQADEVHVMLGEALVELKRDEEALATWTKLIEQFPNSSLRFQALYRSGQVHANRKQYSRAIGCYDQLLSQPAPAGLKEFATYGKAWSMMQEQNYAGAADLLQPLAASDRKDGLGMESKLAYAICLRQTDRNAEANDRFNQLISMNPTGTLLGNVLYEQGIAFAQTNQFQNAYSNFQRIVQEFPEYPMMDRVLYELGWAAKQLDRVDEAIESFQSLIDRYPQSSLVAEAAYHVGQGQYSRQKYQAAMVSYRKVIDQAQDAALIEKSLYKLGWSLFQEKEYVTARDQFQRQLKEFPKGELSLDGQFMIADCESKLGNFSEALTLFRAARKTFESMEDTSRVNEQLQVLIYLNGAQAARELKQWKECENWLRVIVDQYPSTPYLPQVIYELAFCNQNLKNKDEALRLYGEVAEKYRTEIAARARFMMGELYFAEREFTKAIPEFQRVMYGFGAAQAPSDIKNWQARSAFEAGRCAEVLIGDAKGEKRDKAIKLSKDFYQYIINEHGQHELVEQARQRLEALSKL